MYVYTFICGFCNVSSVMHIILTHNSKSDLCMCNFNGSCTFCKIYTLFVIVHSFFGINVCTFCKSKCTFRIYVTD